ncbi:hypothetical protein QFZ58_000248 [Streptomyces sp. B1I3]|nr:hypothetical protein [Streptomyces sp. B1I3]
MEQNAQGLSTEVELDIAAEARDRPARARQA